GAGTAGRLVAAVSSAQSVSVRQRGSPNRTPLGAACTGRRTSQATGTNEAFVVGVGCRVHLFARWRGVSYRTPKPNCRAAGSAGWDCTPRKNDRSLRHRALAGKRHRAERKVAFG